MTQNDSQEKMALAYQRSLAALGVEANVRTVDDSQYQQRSQSFDYDVIIKSYPSSLSPGIEQVGRWSSVSRDRPGSDNFAGVADKDVDTLVNAILQARTIEDFTAAVRAHDRLLVSTPFSCRSTMCPPSGWPGTSGSGDRARSRSTVIPSAHGGTRAFNRSENVQHISIDVVSDVVCPWCYLGRRVWTRPSTR